MKEFWNTIFPGFITIGRWVGWFLGGYDGLLYALITFVIVDYATGVMCGIIYKKLSSAAGLRVIEKKVLIFLLVGITNILDVKVIGTGGFLRTATTLFYISNEGMSFLENVTCLGLPIPKKLKAVLEQIYDRAEADTGKKDN